MITMTPPKAKLCPFCNCYFRGGGDECSNCSNPNYRARAQMVNDHVPIRIRKPPEPRQPRLPIHRLKPAHCSMLKMLAECMVQGISPVLREMSAVTGLRSSATIYYNLKRMQNIGLVDHHPYHLRAYRLTSLGLQLAYYYWPEIFADNIKEDPCQ